MQVNGAMRRIDRLKWVSMPGSEVDPAVLARCTGETIEAALGQVDGARVHSVAVNQTGQYEVRPNVQSGIIPGYAGHTETDLPEFCEVIVDVPTGKHTIKVRVWLPFVWNGRFLGCGGGGNRLEASFFADARVRQSSLPTALRNGFACATSDGGYGEDDRLIDWHTDPTTGELDRELLTNWAHRSTELMTRVGQAVTAAIHGRLPSYSYFVGTSGGGRQGVVQAQRYPDSYDGIWANDPGLFWTHFIPAMLWPSLVMKERHSLSPAKLDAFRRVAMTARRDESGFDVTRHVDAALAIGVMTDEGEITSDDAEVMQLIWDGPCDKAGNPLWFGPAPGIETWGAGFYGSGVCTTQVEDGERVPVPFLVAPSWFTHWVQDADLDDWRSLTFDSYAELFERGREDYAGFASDETDLRALRESGHKLLITHGTHDPVISPQGTLHFFEEAVADLGGREAAESCVRLFLCDGDGHSGPGLQLDGTLGPSLDLAEGMLALMCWVEDGKGPEELTLRQVDDETDEVKRTTSVARTIPR